MARMRGEFMGRRQNPGRAALLGGGVLFSFLLATLLGGANAVAVRFTVAEPPPFWGAALRFSPPP